MIAEIFRPLLCLLPRLTYPPLFYSLYWGGLQFGVQFYLYANRVGF
jgi:hypothetical protein